MGRPTILHSKGKDMKTSLDKVGMACSTVCFWHCMIFPFLIALFPMVAFFRSEVFEWSFIGTGVGIAVFAMLQGYVQHKRLMPTALAISGFLLFAIAHMIFESDGINYAHIGLSLLAGCIIFSAHYINHHFINRHCSCDHEHS